MRLLLLTLRSADQQTLLLCVVLQILGVHLQRRGLPLAEDVSVDEIAKMTMGFTGADLANLVNEVRPQVLASAALICWLWSVFVLLFTTLCQHEADSTDALVILLQAALLAGRSNKAVVGREEFSQAVLRSVAGIEKKRSVLQGLEKDVVARHEVGHEWCSVGAAVVAGGCVCMCYQV